MSSVDDIRQRLIESRLMTAETAQACIARWQQATGDSETGTGDKLLAWLVEEQLLTDFQRDVIDAGQHEALLVGPYRLLARVAVGRLGNLYRAVHEELNQIVGLKVLLADAPDHAEQIARMQREVRVSAELEHPNIVRMFQVGEVDGVCYLASEDLQGETLQERLRRGGRLAYPVACGLMRDAALGLGHLHDRFLAHRDVCPANMWLTEDGALKVMELGVVLAATSPMGDATSEDLTTPGTIVGTYDYMAPEQAQDANVADQRSDIYSLGCTLYHCLAGQPPFVDTDPLQVVLRHAQEPPAPISSRARDIPAELEEAINTMLAKSPDDRFQSMEDVARSLEQFADTPIVDTRRGTKVLEQYLLWLGET